MRKLPAVLAASAATLLAGVSPASAAVLIDAFLDNTVDLIAPGSPNSTITNNIDGSEIDRQISVAANGNMSIVSTVLDGFFVFDANTPDSGSASAQIEYLGFVLDLSDNLFFQFDVSRIEGSALLGVILTDAAFGQISGAAVLTPTETGTSYFLDLTQFSGYTPGFGSQLNSVLVLIDAGAGSHFVQGDSIQFSSVPEPSAGLLLAAGFAALASRRRSRR